MLLKNNIKQFLIFHIVKNWSKKCHVNFNGLPNNILHSYMKFPIVTIKFFKKNYIIINLNVNSKINYIPNLLR